MNSPQTAKLDERSDTPWFDDDLVAVVKPVGLPTHSPDGGATPGLVERLRHALGFELGVHQRLDAETSGVVVFSRSARAAAALALQFETHSVDKQYLAVVVGHPDPAQPVLLDSLAPGPDGRMVPRPDGKTAETRIETIATAGPFALCRLRPRTGRTHQLRAQLAARGTPILGDRVYGGGDGTGRLLLHAHRLTIDHPAGDTITFEAAAPELLREETFSLQHVLRALIERWPRGDAESALRVSVPAQTGLPGCKVDRYGAIAVCRVYEPATGATLWDPSAQALLGTELVRSGHAATVLGFDHRQHGRRGGAGDGAPPRLLAGPAPRGRSIVQESGVRYEIAFDQGLGCGLYLDHHETRAWIAQNAAGLEVLNLFAYTCAFSVAAAVGGAARTTSVDVARAALAWGKRNFEVNGLDPGVHRFFSDDAFTALRRASNRGEQYGIVVCDPPSFARSGSKAFSLETQLDELVGACAAVVARGGWLVFSLNHRKIRLRRLGDAVRKACTHLRRPVEALELSVLEDGHAALGVGTDLKLAKARLA